MTPKQYERLFAFIAATYVILLLGYVVTEAYYAPPEWDVFTVFDISYRGDNEQTTIILTYGKGKHRLKGHYTLELDHTYYLEYQPGIRFTPSTVLELMEVDPC